MTKMRKETGETLVANKHIFALHCPKCRGTAYFDKRVVCTEDGGSVVRREFVVDDVDNKTLDRLFLRCNCDGCIAEIIVEVDCGAYK